MNTTICQRDERRLISAAQGRDQQAFQELVDTYQPLLLGTARRILRDEEAAADATQEALFSAYRGITGFRGGSFKAWMLRIVTNACYDQLRRQKRRPTSSLETLLSEPHTQWVVADGSQDPERELMWRDLGEAIQRGLGTLSTEHRTAVVLSDIDELSYGEIAAVVGAPVGTIKSRISRGRAQLRGYLQQYGMESGYAA